MKVLHISGARGWGGNEQQMMDLIPELTKLGVDSLVFGVKDSQVQQQCGVLNISFIAAKSDKLNKFANYKFLKHLVGDFKPDVIHLHTSDSLTVFTVSDMLFGLKVKAVFSKKGMGSSSSILSKFKYNYKNVSRIICVSEAVRKSFGAIINASNQSKLTVVYDGVNLSRTHLKRFENLRDLFVIKQDIIIGNIANHAKAKDIPILILAMDHLVNHLGVKDVHLIQIGDFSAKLTPEIKEMITAFKLEEYITLAGFQNHAMDFLAQFDCYVMSSEREGLPITIFEAFYKKTPVVSTTAGGIPEAITDDYNGYLSDVKDFKSLALNIKKMIGNPAKKQEFIERSYEIFFKRFTAEITAANTLKIYNETVNQ